MALSKYAKEVQARRHATAKRKVRPLDHALWLVHQNLPMSGQRIAQSQRGAMAPARIDWAKMSDLAGWILMSINGDLLVLAQSKRR